jgi:hypothetical protein
MGRSSICVFAVVVAAAGCKGGAPPESAAPTPTAASAPRADKPSQPDTVVLNKALVDR